MHISVFSLFPTQLTIGHQTLDGGAWAPSFEESPLSSSGDPGRDGNWRRGPQPHSMGESLVPVARGEGQKG